MRGMERLLELQRTDLEIDRSQARKAELESGEDLQAARTAMEDAESGLGEIRLALDETAREQRRLEHEIETLSAKADAEQKRLYSGSIVNTRELGALTAEIKSLSERRARTEDELLEYMVRKEELEPRAGEAESALAAARSHVEEVGGEAAAELESIGASLDDLAARRAALSGEMDEELLELYEDLRRQKKGVGAAALSDGVCQGCHEKLSALELDRLKKTEGIKRCEYCRRIVVFA